MDNNQRLECLKLNEKKIELKKNTRKLFEDDSNFHSTLHIKKEI